MSHSASNIVTILAEAVELASEDERRRYLDQACHDSDLRKHVECLINNHFKAGSFLEPAVADLAVTQDPSSDFDAEGRQIGPYKLREIIGEGGMGIVYVAEQEQPIHRKVALKLIKPGLDTREVISRFEAERQALAVMDHPHIAKVFDAGVTSSGRSYFVMELVRGVPITEFCNEYNLTTRARLELFVKVCRAIQHAHQKGIIHRDIKPSNVLVTLHDDEAVPVVIDFGIAKATNQRLSQCTVYTHHAQMIGTPLYMSPEQAEMNALDVDTRSDIYSLGVLLYELLTGMTPFDGQQLREASFDELRRIIREVEPPAPSQRISTLDAKALSTAAQKRGVDQRRFGQVLRGELDWIVMKALEKDRRQRYESATSFAADIQRYLDDEPVQAYPPSIAYRSLKIVRRYRVAAVVAAVVTFTMLGSAAFSSLKYIDERAARQDADEQKLVAFHSAKNAENHAAEATRQRSEAVRQKTEAELQRDAARQSLYLADMHLAFLDIGLGNTTRARDSLLAHVLDQAETDRRAWEWYYLLGRSHEADQACYSHSVEVSCIAWSPDGHYIASASSDGSVRVWDAETGKQLRRIDQGPTIKKSICWSPDSKMLAWGSASDEAALRIWNRDTDKFAVVHGHQGSICAVAWSHTGKYVATGSIHLGDRTREPGNVRIWDVEKLESVAQFTSAYHAARVSWSPDDKLLAVASIRDGRIIWDVATQQQLPDVVTEHSQCVAWHPTDSQLAIGDSLGNCLIWDRRSQAVIRQWKAHQGALANLEWNGDATQLLSSGGDGMVKIWDAKEGREEKSVAAHAGGTRSVAWDPTGKRFASSGTDGVIRIWTAENRPSPLAIDTQLQGSLDLAWDNSSSNVLLASGDAGKIGVWDACSGKMREEISLQQDGNRRLVSFRHVIEQSSSLGGAPSVVSVSSVPASASLAKAVSPTAFNTGYTGYFVNALLSPDRTRIAYVSNIGRPFISDLHSDRVLLCPEVNKASGMAWSPNGRLLAVVGCGTRGDEDTPLSFGWVHLFDADSGRRVRRLRIGTSRLPGRAVAWSHDGLKLAAGHEEGLCDIWEAESGRKLLSVRVHSSRVNDLAWSLDDQRIASGGMNGQVHLWDSSTGQELLALEPHGSPIRHIRWSPDGRKLAAVSDDGVIRVWDATNGYELPQRDLWRHLIEPSQRKEYARLIDEQRWSEAANLLKKMIAAGGPECRPMYLLAHVNLQLDDQAAYRATCKRMLSTFAGTEGNYEAQSTAWVCALRPGTLEDYSVAITLARQELDRELNSRTKRQSPSGDLLEMLGAVLFRAGQYKEALSYLQAASERDTSHKKSAARIEFLLAMTHKRLGHAADAQMWLDRANKEADLELNNSSEPLDWILRLQLSLFQREAKELIGG